MPRYQVKAEVAARCLERLRQQKIHDNFAGYLCVRREAARYGQRSDLQVNFKETFDTFFRVHGAPDDRPYAKPFSESSPSEANKWFNKNVAGSYAQSSLRSGSPFRKVIDVEGDKRNTRYTLKEGDAKLALKHLLYNQPIPTAHLAAFLYREFGIDTDNPGIAILVPILMEEFGFSALDARNDFNTLFYYDREELGEEDWLELVQ